LQRNLRLFTLHRNPQRNRRWRRGWCEEDGPRNSSPFKPPELPNPPNPALIRRFGDAENHLSAGNHSESPAGDEVGARKTATKFLSLQAAGTTKSTHPSSIRRLEMQRPSLSRKTTTNRPPATRLLRAAQGSEWGFGFSLFGRANSNRRVCRKRRAGVSVAVGPHHVSRRKMEIDASRPIRIARPRRVSTL
jgi:hypothetical protein